MPRFLITILAFMGALPFTPVVAAEPCSEPVAVCASDRAGALALITDGKPLPIISDSGDLSGVAEAVADLRADLGAVAGNDAPRNEPMAVIIGTIGHNKVIDRLIAQHRIDVGGIAGKWEHFVQVVVDDPDAAIRRALVIVGSDRRGTIFGAYDLSRQIGVSPWRWWADVPVVRQPNLWVSAGARVDGPAVKYRGIFLNDEEPALGGWARAKFGGLNHEFYRHVFELTLRLKGNFLWPAQWSKSLWDDDPETAKLADRMGVVLGTSHHEPFERAHVEWERYGKGPWDYTRNAATLRAFWRQGMERNAGRESLITIGMRGDGDEAMTQGTAIPLLERIVADQRSIIADVTGKPASETPQVWALYKEVQDYYDQGMKVPDDVTLLFSDDNWGNIRRLPKPGEHRPGGYGIYYHFDYVGGPRNYKWINTTQISRVWEQMKLARASGADRLWIVNVGDLKPMEFPISFFLDLAWNPDGVGVDQMADYPRRWAAEQFGAGEAAAIGDVIDRSNRMIARRKPELRSAETFVAIGAAEQDRVLAEHDAIERDALAIEARLPADARDAYFELVLHPVLSLATLDRLFIAVARNREAAARGEAAANDYADRAEQYFAQDAALSARYEALAGSKWPHMMDQVHIGYTGWQQPDAQEMPKVERVTGTAAAHAVRAAADACAGATNAQGAYAECNGAIVIEAAHFVAKQSGAGAKWDVIPGLGRTLSAISVFPQVGDSFTPSDRPGVSYPVWFDSAGAVNVRILASPSLDTAGRGAMRYAVAIGNEKPKIIDLWGGDQNGNWAKAVSDAVRASSSEHQVKAGKTVLHLWAVDRGLVIQRIEIDRGDAPPGYLGRRESARR